MTTATRYRARLLPKHTVYLPGQKLTCYDTPIVLYVDLVYSRTDTKQIWYGVHTGEESHMVREDTLIAERWKAL